MDADQPFLNAIRENPADDTARLVYADWLDERGDPRGEYLRLVCEVLRLGDRLAALRAVVPDDWAAAVSPRCRVVLVRVDPERVFQAVRMIRELTDEGINDIRGRLARPPVVLRGGLSFDAARRLAEVFAPVGEVAVETDRPAG